MKLGLVRSFMEVEGNLNLDMTWMGKDGSVKFSGHRLYGRCEDRSIKITMDKYQIEAIEECEGVQEIYRCYKEMEYF